MAASSLSKSEADLMLSKVRYDRSLSKSVRDRALRYAAPVSESIRAVSRLQTFARRVLPGITCEIPQADLVRVTSAATFLRHLAAQEARDAFLTVDDFIAYMTGSSDPSGDLDDLLDGQLELFAWERSWMAEAAGVRGLDGTALVQALELSYDPPLVLFELPLRLLSSEGVLVRTPCSLDSVLGPNPQWRPGGPASGVREFVDRSIPRSAVQRMRWVP